MQLQFRRKKKYVAVHTKRFSIYNFPHAVFTFEMSSQSGRSDNDIQLERKFNLTEREKPFVVIKVYK